jgi:integrase
LAEIRTGHGKRPLGEYVFPGTGAVGHRQNIKRDWRALCKAAKIAGLRVHDLRHSFASQLASGGASLPLIGALLGHSSPATTARYSHMFSDPQRAAAERVGAVIGAAGMPAGEPVKIRGA